jgi:hypothetical protein
LSEAKKRGSRLLLVGPTQQSEEEAGAEAELTVKTAFQLQLRVDVSLVEEVESYNRLAEIGYLSSFTIMEMIFLTRRRRLSACPPQLSLRADTLCSVLFYQA